MLNDNIDYLSDRFPYTLKALQNMEDKLKAQPVLVETAKSGEPTLKRQKDGREYYIHSKYNPVQEAEKFVAQFQDVDKYKHVFFYGVGLGYHIELFLRKYPHVSASIFEPDPAIMYKYLSTRSLSSLPLNRVCYLVTNSSLSDVQQFLLEFATFLKDEKIFFVILPSYERIFKDEYKSFVTMLREAIARKRLATNAEYFYEKKQTVNSVKNLKQLISTANIFQVERKLFQNKPAIIAAAGPSLTDELDQLKVIKENGLAYIIAVGSGLGPLLKKGIIPDAVCSYDANNNYITLAPVYKGNIQNVPLLFGSFIGLEQLPEYPGAKFHFLMADDQIARYYLPSFEGEKERTIPSHPTVSGIALEILYRLGCNPIVFVGQNLAYKNNRSYAEGINVYNKLYDQRLQEGGLIVESVDGGEVYSNEDFNYMRYCLEVSIGSKQDCEIINSTKDGAKIAGASFIALGQLVKERFKCREVEENWTNSINVTFDFSDIKKRQIQMDADYASFKKYLDQVERLMKQIERCTVQKNKVQLKNSINQFDQVLKKTLNNRFYAVFLKYMEKVELELLAKKMDEIRFEADMIIKGRKVLDHYGAFFVTCRKDLQTLEPYYLEWKEFITKKGN